MAQKRNVVLYLDSELVEKSKELGFNLSKTFENHLKRLVNHIDSVYAQNNSHGWWTGPDLNRQPSARQALILDQDTDWMEFRGGLNSKNFVGRRCRV